jgi:uncharacterized membrane protein
MTDPDIIDMPGPTNPAGRTPQELSGLKTVAMVVYALQALSFFWGLPAIVAIIIDYVKREDARGTVYETHIDWQISTFWWGLVWTVLGLATMWVFGLGMIVLAVAYIWLIYRVVKGFLRLTEGRPVHPA